MELILKISAVGIVAAILATTVRSQNKELALLVSIAACIILCVAGTDSLKNLKEYLEKLQQAAGIQDGVILPVTKACAICALTYVCGIFCKDAGEDAVGKIVLLCGNAAAVCAVIPLMDLVWASVSDFLGG